ncbi:hypothetical protein HDU79_002474 [Rhizoclosmatium sp. JEL0117]|nr:hypothetical protein HDU79_002474 [Rhizoclosmatium sp. JEL0117]
MAENTDALTMAQRLALWREQRSAQTQTQTQSGQDAAKGAAKAVVSQGQQTVPTLTPSNPPYSPHSPPASSFQRPPALSNKLRVNGATAAPLAKDTKDTKDLKDQKNDPPQQLALQVPTAAQVAPNAKRSKVGFDVAQDQQTTAPSSSAFTFVSPQSQIPQTDREQILLLANKSLQDQNKSLHAQYQSLLSQNTDLQSQNTSLQSQLQSATHTTTQLHKDLAVTKQKLIAAETPSTSTEDHDHQISSLRALVSAKQVQIQNLLESVSCYETQIQKQTTHINSLDAETAVLRTEAAALRAEATTVRSESASLRIQLGQVKGVVENQRHRISEMTLRLAEAEGRAVEMRRRVLEGVSKVLRVVDEREVVVGEILRAAVGQEEVEFMEVEQYRRVGVEMLDVGVQTVGEVSVGVFETAFSDAASTASVETCNVAIQCNIIQEVKASFGSLDSESIGANFTDLESEITTLLHHSAKHAETLETHLASLTESYNLLQTSSMELQQTLEITTEAHETNTLLLQTHLTAITTRVNQLVTTLAESTHQSPPTPFPAPPPSSDPMTPQESAEALHAQIDTLKQHLATSLETLSTLESSLHEQQSLTTAAHQTIEDLHRERDQSAVTMRARVIELDMLRAEVKEAYDMIDLLQSEEEDVGRGKKSRSDVDVDELEREVKGQKERLGALYSQVEALEAKNRGLMNMLERKEKKLKEVVDGYRACREEKEKVCFFQCSVVVGPREEMECQTDLTILTLKQAENAIANVKLLKLDNDIMKCEMQKEQKEYTKKITKLMKEVEESEQLEAHFKVVQEKAVSAIEELMASNEAKEKELTALRQRLDGAV